MFLFERKSNLARKQKTGQAHLSHHKYMVCIDVELVEQEAVGVTEVGDKGAILERIGKWVLACTCAGNN
jgi:hypothetical protein